MIRRYSLIALAAFLVTLTISGIVAFGPATAHVQSATAQEASAAETGPNEREASSDRADSEEASTTKSSSEKGQPGQASKGDAADPNGKEDSLALRYYEKQLELAKHEYEMALAENRDIPGVNAKLTLLRLRQQMRYAQQMLEHAKQGSTVDTTSAMVQLAENDATLARKQLEWAIDARSEYVGAIPERDMKQLRLSAQLANLALERAKQLQGKIDPIEQLQWQMDRMRSEVLSLQVKITREAASGL